MSCCIESYKEQPKRNVGIDFLRVLSMYMVVVIHVLLHGGVLDSAKDILGYSLAQFLEITCYCCVNCFAMITGYVMYTSRPRISKISEMWLQIAFYTIIIQSIFLIISPENYDIGEILQSVFPITRNAYWYTTAYFGLYICIPLLNVVVAKTNKKILSMFFIVAYLQIHILPTLLMNNDAYRLSGGYSMIWLCALYLLGAHMNKYEVISKIKVKYAVGLFLISIIITFISKFVLDKIQPIFIGNIIGSNLLVLYTSPTIILSGIGLFIACLKIKFSPVAKRIILYWAPAAFGVFLIHDNNIIRKMFISGFAKDFVNYGPFLMILLVLLSALAIYIICMVIELGRMKLFKLLKIKSLCFKLEKALCAFTDKIFQE